jgi:hypothetical protein
MILKRVRMLRIEDQRAGGRESEPWSRSRGFWKPAKRPSLKARNVRRDLWVGGVLRLQQQNRRNRGLARRYVEKLTGLRRAQVRRLIGSYLASGEVRGGVTAAPLCAALHACRCRAAGQLDEARETLSASRRSGQQQRRKSSRSAFEASLG